MNDSQKQKMLEAGVDLEGALERFMENEKLYENYLRRFTESTDYQELEIALSTADWKRALDISHNQKGVSGSLGFSHLHELLSSQVLMLRQDQNDSARSLMTQIMAEHQRLWELAKEIV